MPHLIDLSIQSLIILFKINVHPCKEHGAALNLIGLPHACSAWRCLWEIQSGLALPGGLPGSYAQMPDLWETLPWAELKNYAIDSQSTGSRGLPRRVLDGFAGKRSAQPDVEGHHQQEAG